MDVNITAKVVLKVRNDITALSNLGYFQINKYTLKTNILYIIYYLILFFYFWIKKYILLIGLVMNHDTDV
jgi:hypothetical protein